MSDRKCMLGVCKKCNEWIDFYSKRESKLESFSTFGSFGSKENMLKWFSSCCNTEQEVGSLEHMPLDD